MESYQKLKIVLEGLSSQIEIIKLCNKYQISQTIYYRWLDQLLSYGHQAFHPLWSYCCCWAYLTYRQGFIVNKKRIYRLMKEDGILVTKQTRYQVKRKPSCPKPKASYPNQIWGTDMTKIKIGSWGWYYLVIVLDCYSKEIIGYRLSLQSKSTDWQEALEQAVQKRFSSGIRDSLRETLYLVSYNGCQPTSLSYMKCCASLGIKQITTCWSSPEGNADIERVIKTLKRDLIWPHDGDHHFDFQRTLGRWIDNYNQDFRHQALGYRTPCEYYREYIKNKEPILT